MTDTTDTGRATNSGIRRRSSLAARLAFAAILLALCAMSFYSGYHFRQVEHYATHNAIVEKDGETVSVTAKKLGIDWKALVRLNQPRLQKVWDANCKGKPTEGHCKPYVIDGFDYAIGNIVPVGFVYTTTLEEPP